MCGFAGVLSLETGNHGDGLLQGMADAIAHRGPDDSGIWSDRDGGLSLCHRRLSIVDLSPAGHQPMASACGRLVMAYNGEVYNHPDLRHSLERAGQAPDWKGHSDTETLLACIRAWGLEQTLQKATGMFALALWDREERTLSLARDRLGEKPLYYGWQGGAFLFGSELKALKVHPAFRGDIDRNALTLLLRHNYIPVPHSIYNGIHKLPPGTILTLEAATGKLPSGQSPDPTPYWSLHDIVRAGRETPFAGSDSAAVDTLDTLLRGAVGRQMMADVPLGAFLSGGIDSTTVVALMQAQSTRPVKTFTIGFHERGYNEAQHAKAVARHLGTDHTELYVSPKDAMDIIPRLPALYDEPFSDSSQMPTFLVSQMTRQHVTVSLSGDGGDELFGGYNRYSWVSRVWGIVRLFPRPLWKTVAAAIRTMSPATLNTLVGQASRVLPGRFSVALPGDKAHKLAGILAAGSQENMFRGLVSHCMDPAAIVRGAREPDTVLMDPSAWPEMDDFRHCMMYLDTLSYLPDDILTKVDRAAMGTSLETRVPFLDHSIVEFAWTLPLHMKIRNGQGKWVLRQVLDNYVPREFMERPKMGFGIPVDSWLRGPLRDWAENLLDPARLRQEGFLDPAAVQQKWQEHLSGQRNWQSWLWNILMFQAWLEQERE